MFTVTTTPAELAEHPLISVTVTEYVPDVVTLIAFVVAPVDQVFPEASDDVKLTEFPTQNVKGPSAEIVGVGGGVGSVNATFNVLDVQPIPSSNVILYDPAVNEPIVCGNVTPVAEPLAVPVQEIFPVPLPETSIDPVAVAHAFGSVRRPAEITGAGFTVIVVVAEVEEQPFALVCVTKYPPAAVTVISEEVSPVDQTFPVG